MAKLLYEVPPESVLLSNARIAGLFPDCRMDHDEAAGRIDEDRLATYSPQHEHPPIVGQYPDLIT